MKYTVVRKWPDHKWHTEGRGLTLRKARNLYFRLLKDIMSINPNDLRIICEQDIFDVIISEVNEQTGGIIV